MVVIRCPKQHSTERQSLKSPMGPATDTPRTWSGHLQMAIGVECRSVRPVYRSSTSTTVRRTRLCGGISRYGAMFHSFCQPLPSRSSLYRETPVASCTRRPSITPSVPMTFKASTRAASDSFCKYGIRDSESLTPDIGPCAVEVLAEL